MSFPKDDNRQGRRPHSGRSHESSSSGVSWLLSVIESGHTLPPLDYLLEADGGLSAVQAGPNHGDFDGSGNTASGAPRELEMLQKWTNDFENTIMHTSIGRGVVWPNAGNGRLNTSTSPYISHKFPSVAQKPICSRGSNINKRGLRRKEDVVQTYANVLSNVSMNDEKSLGTKDLKMRISLAIAAHISKEAASKNKNKMAHGRFGDTERSNWTTMLTSTKGTFDDMAEEKRKAELETKIFSGSVHYATKSHPENFDGDDTMIADTPVGVLNNRLPFSSQDPLYRIMREEAEMAVKRRDTKSPTLSPCSDLEDCDMDVVRSKQRNFCEQHASQIERELQLMSTQMISVTELNSLRRFETISSDMWITMRVVYFLFLSYFEVMLCPTRAANSVSTTGGTHLPKASISVDAYQRFTNEKSTGSSVSINMGDLWNLVDSQCKENDITSSVVIVKFTWAHVRAMLDLPHEFSCALVFIERGEDFFDTKMAEMLGGVNSESDFWRSGTFYEKFPEENLFYLRFLVAPAMFSPKTTVSKSPTCARLCAWARRVAAGLFASKCSSMRSLIVSSDSVNIPRSSESNPSPLKFQQEWHSSTGQLSINSGSVFNRSNLSTQSPKRRIEQFVNYPGTALGSLLDRLQQLDPFTFDVAVSCTSTFTFDSGYDGTDKDIASLICATLILARPSDRVEINLFDPEEGPETLTSEKSREMMTIIVKHNIEKMLMGFSFSPFHRIICEEKNQNLTKIDEDLVSFTKLDDLAASPRGSYYFSSTSNDANRNHSDLLVVNFLRVQDSTRLKSYRKNVALVFCRHWALHSKPQPTALSISRFVVFVSNDEASMRAFKLTLRLAKPCDLIFLIHAVPSLTSGEKRVFEEPGSAVIAQFRHFGFNVHLDVPLEDDDEAFPSYAESNTANLAQRLAAVAREYSPTHILMGANPSDIDFALAGPYAQEFSDRRYLSLVKQMVLIASEGAAGAHTLILTIC